MYRKDNKKFTYLIFAIYKKNTYLCCRLQEQGS